MKEIDFHPHALDKMAEREISADEVIAALRTPDFVLAARLGRKCAGKKHGDHWLRVIFEEETLKVLVITTYLTRRR